MSDGYRSLIEVLELGDEQIVAANADGQPTSTADTERILEYVEQFVQSHRHSAEHAEGMEAMALDGAPK